MQMNTIPAAPARAASAPVPTPAALRTRASASTHPGLVRPFNEDHFLIANIQSAIQVVQASVCPNQVYFGPRPTGLFVVADGMGGHAAGERASAIAVVSMEKLILRALSEMGPMRQTDPAVLLAAGFKSADDAVFDAARERASLTGMGTTMTAALVVGDEVFLGHAGDSRAYLLRAGQLSRLTRDHTVVTELEGAGVLAPAEAADHPFRNVVTNAIGGRVPGVTPDIKRFEAWAGDRMLLCSDGLTDMVTDEELKHILAAGEDPDVTSAHLVQAALEGGGRDNITALVIVFDPT
jgi:protein phosphatase